MKLYAKTSGQAKYDKLKDRSWIALEDRPASAEKGERSKACHLPRHD
jgi:hypothetical protein